MTYSEYLPEGTAGLQKEFNKELNSKNAQNLQEQMGKCSIEGSKQPTNQPQKRPGAAGWKRRQVTKLANKFRDMLKAKKPVEKKKEKQVHKNTKKTQEQVKQLEEQLKEQVKQLKKVTENLSKFKFK